MKSNESNEIIKFYPGMVAYSIEDGLVVLGSQDSRRSGLYCSNRVTAVYKIFLAESGKKNESDASPSLYSIDEAIALGFLSEEVQKVIRYL